MKKFYLFSLPQLHFLLHRFQRTALQLIFHLTEMQTMKVDTVIIELNSKFPQDEHEYE